MFIHGQDGSMLSARRQGIKLVRMSSANSLESLVFQAGEVVLARLAPP